jgi:hypothetical protein
VVEAAGFCTMGSGTYLHVNYNFKSLSGINTALVPVVFSTDISTQMEPNFISWDKNTVMYCLHKPVTKMCSIIITVFSYLNVCYFIYVDVNILSSEFLV